VEVEGGAAPRPRSRRGRWSRRELARLKALYGLHDDASIARELKRHVGSVRKLGEKLLRGSRRTGPWTAEETQQLKHYLGATSEDVIARILGRTSEEVRQRILELGRIEKGGTWARVEIAEFKKLYGTRTDESLARIFGRSEEAVARLAKKLAIAKDKAFLCRIHKGERRVRMPRWTEKEIATLRELYPTLANLEIAKRLDRSVKSVVSQAHSLGLKKGVERLRKMGRENISLRYRGK
jgi:hypothetical protein